MIKKKLNQIFNMPSFSTMAQYFENVVDGVWRPRDLEKLGMSRKASGEIV